ncbi:MAG: Spy/CpxP family protein refolding chaperone [Deltaproteobacteria bacterium]|nr:Spy/CpxP family protein refolding chaperone [Deltaproteobacteria bacterium]
MLKLKNVLVAVIVAMGIALVLPTLAQAEADDEARSSDRRPGGSRHGARRGPDPGRFIDRHGEELGVDAETRESIQAIADASRMRSQRIRGEIEVEEATMRELLSQPSPDEAAVMSQGDRLGALKSQHRKNRLEAMLAIRKLLTPEQREQLIGMREGRRQGRGEGRRFDEEGGPRRGERSGKGRRGPRAGCRDDMAKLCSGSESGRARLQCLDAQWENLSDDCRAAFEGRGRRGPRPDRPVDSGTE